MKHVLASCLLITVLSVAASGQTLPGMRWEDRVRIAEARKISLKYGEKIWPGMDKIPFSLILITDSVEFLMFHPSPTAEFAFLAEDTVLDTKVYYRKTVFNKRFLATFPAVGGINTIVVGTPENTGRHSADWIITLLHEHFHQYTYSSPGYYADAAKLDLAGGDSSGMWMLNYAFPYTDSAVISRYGDYTSALSNTVSGIATDAFRKNLSDYLLKRRSFKDALKPADYRYFSFQIWQEGLARYTEYKFLELLDNEDPLKEVAGLPDFIPFRKFRETFYREHLRRASEWPLNKNQRDCFYALGFAEGLILDKLNPTWRTKYLTDRFNIEHYAEEFGSSKK